MRVAWIKPEDLPAIGEFISAQFPDLTASDMYVPQAAVAFVDDAGETKGALCLRMLNRFDAELSIYCEPAYFPRSANLRDLFKRAFHGLKVVRLTCTVARSNKRARRLVEHVGFKLEGVKKRGYDGRRAGCIYGMTVDDCPWLEARPDAGS